MNRVRALWLLLLLAAASGIAFVLPGRTGHSSGALGLQKADTIRIGYAVEAPYAFIAADGTVTGESPEVARRIVERLGIPRIEWRLSDFSELIPELENGRIDVIAAGMFITAERASRVSFSTPTAHVRQGLLVARGNPNDLHDYADTLRTSEAKVAVLSGSIEETLLTRLGAIPAQLMRVPDARTGRIAVESGTAQGLALSQPSLRWLAIRNELGNTEIAEPFTQPMSDGQPIGYVAFAFRKDDTRLLAAWNAVQAGYVATPAHRELVAGFGFSTDELPGTIGAPGVPAR